MVAIGQGVGHRDPPFVGRAARNGASPHSLGKQIIQLTKTCIIAEIGENHAGDWELARKMIAAAGQAGADVVKFQSYHGSDVSTEDPEKDWFKRVELSDSIHFELKKTAERYGVRFLSS